MARESNDIVLSNHSEGIENSSVKGRDLDDFEAKYLEEESESDNELELDDESKSDEKSKPVETTEDESHMPTKIENVVDSKKDQDDSFTSNPSILKRSSLSDAKQLTVSFKDEFLTASDKTESRVSFEANFFTDSDKDSEPVVSNEKKVRETRRFSANSLMKSKVGKRNVVQYDSSSIIVKERKGDDVSEVDVGGIPGSDTSFKRLLVRTTLGLFAFFSYTFLITDLSTGLNITDPSNPTLTSMGLIMINGDPRPLVANNAIEWWCLAFARTSAFVMYIDLILIFLTKCRSTLNLLYQTPLATVLPREIHEIHAHSGVWICWTTWFHTFFHLLRWGLAGNMNLLYQSNAGLTGLVCCIFIPFLTFLMMYEKLKRKIPYEYRKGLHYLFYPFAIILCFHAPISALPMAGYIGIVMGSAICFYALDNLYVFFFMTEMTETKSFQVLVGTGVQFTCGVSKTFQNRLDHGGYAYVCFPWISNNQWHAFSLFENVANPAERQVFMMKNGDWTSALYETLLSRDTARPVWVSGPFFGSFNFSQTFDNVILVASGIGIAPSLSAISSQKNSARVNLIWAVRDPYMLEFFLERMENIYGWILIYYTGKKELITRLEDLMMNVKIIHKRPNLEAVIVNIIYAVESKKGLPEANIPTQKEAMMDIILEYVEDLEMEKEEWSTKKKLAELTRFVAGHGFQLAPFFDSNDDRKADAEKYENLKRRSVLRQKKSSQLKPPTLKEMHASDDSFLHLSMNRRSSLKPGSHFSGGPLQLQQLRRRSCLGEMVISSGYMPWKEDGFDENKMFVKGLDKKHILDTWTMCYCGGSKIVEKTLDHITKEYKVSLHKETFFW